MANTETNAMKFIVFMLIAFIIPATLGRSAELSSAPLRAGTAGGQEAQIEGFHHNHLPSSTSPDGLWIIKPIYHNGKFVSYEWTEAKPPAPPEPPQPPAPPKPTPAPVPPVVPTPQCEVIYYIEPTPCAPVGFHTPYRQYGYAARGAGCGFFKRLLGRCR